MTGPSKESGWKRSASGRNVGRDGTFEFSVPEGWVGSSTLGIHAGEIVPGCDLVGYYGPGGFTTRSEDAWLEIGGLGATGIEIRASGYPG